ncbi:Leucine-rich repeat and IQ domain-containing protein 3 [Myotis brandtii]|uniref:Leucine-rich repeat and IQ domain-containing protein 3 n=1 Tax=Myotis brandtii TaxID=109478 RepID=S7PRZ7_MYOBR|nr:Leucine-rich repeat and IQ domain-containing protein 3 [Myotis brandtii]
MFHATVTKELISHKEWSHYNENIIEDQKDFVFVKFTGLHLKSMENLQSCISLKICIFSNNFITNISPLGSCIKLVKLDLHGNQNILSPVDLISLNKQKKHVSSLLSELKKKDIGKKSRHLIQKGQESEDEIEDEELHASFRISVFKLPIHSSDSLKYAVLKKKEQASFPTYTQPLSTTQQKPVITKPHLLLEKNARREFFTIHRTGIKLKTLYDIDEYHLEQKKQESHKKNGIAITKAKTAQEKVSLNVQEMLQKKKRAVQKQMAEDNRAIQNGLYQLWQVRSNYLEKVRERRALFLEEKNQKARDRLLIQNLNNELIIWDRSVNKMKILKKNNDLLKEKHLIVQGKRETERLQKDLRKYMMELRARESCKRHSEEKFVYDMIAFQKACERLQEAKAKIESMKTKVVVKIPRE